MEMPVVFIGRLDHAYGGSLLPLAVIGDRRRQWIPLGRRRAVVAPSEIDIGAPLRVGPAFPAPHLIQVAPDNRHAVDLDRVSKSQ